MENRITHANIVSYLFCTEIHPHVIGGVVIDLAVFIAQGFIPVYKNNVEIKFKMIRNILVDKKYWKK